MCYLKEPDCVHGKDKDNVTALWTRKQYIGYAKRGKHNVTQEQSTKIGIMFYRSF